MRSVICSLLITACASGLPAFAAGCPETSTGSTTHKTLGEIEKAYCGGARKPTAEEAAGYKISEIRDCRAYVEIIAGYDIAVGKPAQGFLSQIETTETWGPMFTIQWIEDNDWYKGVYASIKANDPGLIDRMFFYDLKKDDRAKCFASQVK